MDEERNEEQVRSFVEQMAMFLADWGFPRMAARVLMVLMAADEERLTAGELADRLAVSPAAISGAVRYLQQLQIITRTPVPGSRSDAYEVPRDAWYTAAIVKGGLYKRLADLSDQGVKALGESGAAGTSAGAKAGAGAGAGAGAKAGAGAGASARAGTGPGASTKSGARTGASTRSGAGAERLAEMRDFFLFLDDEVGHLLDRWVAERDRRRKDG